jgi:hypothetical protein
MSKLLIAIAAGFLACLPMASAAPGDDPMIAQLRQIATQGQDPGTARQVNDYIDQNKGALSALLQSCKSYVQQMQTVSGTDETTAPPPPPEQQPAEPQPPMQSGSTTSANTESQASSGGWGVTLVQASGGVQPSGGLQTGHVQPSSGLQTGHLAGYPSLPDVDPISSVKTLTSDQVAYAAKVRQENLARKAELMNSAGQ